MMIKKRKILILMLFSIFILFYHIVPSSADANDKESNDSEYTDEDSPLPDYGPQVFEEAIKRSGFVATRGTMPVITDADEKRKWIDLLVNCSRSLCNPDSTDTGISPYFVEFGGPVMSFGTYIDGYLSVQFEGHSSEKVNESLIDEIYQIVDEHCEQKGISEVPVVFEFGGYENEELLPVDEMLSVDESDDDVNLSENEEIANEESTGNETNNQTPGFTSIMVILGFLSFLIFKRL